MFTFYNTSLGILIQLNNRECLLMLCLMCVCVKLVATMSSKVYYIYYNIYEFMYIVRFNKKNCVNIRLQIETF